MSHHISLNNAELQIEVQRDNTKFDTKQLKSIFFFKRKFKIEHFRRILLISGSERNILLKSSVFWFFLQQPKGKDRLEESTRNTRFAPIFLPRFIGEDELAELEIPQHNTVLVTSRHSLSRLPEESSRLRFPQSPARSYVGVQVAVVTLQEEITPASGCLHHAGHAARRAGALQTKVGLQQCLATFVAHGQRLQSGNATKNKSKSSTGSKFLWKYHRNLWLCASENYARNCVSDKSSFSAWWI